MSIKAPNLDNLKINKLPLIPNYNYNKRHNFHSKKRRNSKKVKENINMGKLSGSYKSKTNYRFKLGSTGRTIEVNKNASGNNSYQNQIFANSNVKNEKNLELPEVKEKLTVNKTNLKGIKTNLDKNKSFVIKMRKEN